MKINFVFHRNRDPRAKTNRGEAENLRYFVWCDVSPVCDDLLSSAGADVGWSGVFHQVQNPF